MKNNPTNCKKTNMIVHLFTKEYALTPLQWMEGIELHGSIWRSSECIYLNLTALVHYRLPPRSEKTLAFRKKNLVPI